MRLLLVLLTALLASIPARAALISGTVFDQGTSQPIGMATVDLEKLVPFAWERVDTTTADVNGNYDFTVRVGGSYRVVGQRH